MLAFWMGTVEYTTCNHLKYSLADMPMERPLSTYCANTTMLFDTLRSLNTVYKIRQLVDKEACLETRNPGAGGLQRREVGRFPIKLGGLSCFPGRVESCILCTETRQCLQGGVISH